MRFVFALFLLPGLLIPVVANDRVNDLETLNREVANNPGENVSRLLSDKKNYDSQKNYANKQIHSYSGWGNTKSRFRLYNPRFDDHYESTGSDRMRVFTY